MLTIWEAVYVRIALPGWAMGTIAADDVTTLNIDEKGHFKHVTITSTPKQTGGVADGTAEILYQTDADSQSIGNANPVSDANKKVIADLLAMVPTFSKDMVEVELSTEWNNGGTLTIVLGDITTGIPSHLPSTDGADPAQPYAGYRLTASSKAKNGTLNLLGSQPSVRVGNIAETRSEANVAAEALLATDLAKDTLSRDFAISPTICIPG